MGAILSLSLRQITGVRRLLVVGLVALAPAALALVARLASENGDGGDGFADGADAVMAGVVMPILTMALATPAFGNDLEDGTLGFVVMTPIARWKIALSKMAAPMLVAAPLAVVSGMAVTYVELGWDVQAMAAVGVGLLIGAAVYSSVFTWAGLMTTRALSFAVVYVFLWEGLASSFVPGTKYLSVRAYAVTVMQWLDSETMADVSSAIEFPAALVGSALALGAFWLLTVHRLKRMDVP